MPGINRGPTTTFIPFGVNPWIPQNEIWVTADPNSISLKNALESCPTDGVVRVWPGLYTDTGVAIGNRINVIFEGIVSWVGTTTLFTLGQDNIKFQGTLKDGTTLWCSHATNDLYDPNGKDYKMENLTLRGNSHFVSEAGCSVVFKNIKIYPTSNIGIKITGGYFYSEGDFQLGEPVNFTPPSDCYGFNITGGEAHFRGRTNVYTDQAAADPCFTVNGGNLTCYPSVIAFAKGTAAVNALQVVSGSANIYAGGIFGNNAAASPTIAIAAGAGNFLIWGCYCKNSNAGGSPFVSNDAPTGDVVKCVMDGGVAPTYGALTTSTDNSTI